MPKGTWSQFLKRALTFLHLTLSGRMSLKEYQIHLEISSYVTPSLTSQPSSAVPYLSCHTLPQQRKKNMLSVTASFLLAFGPNFLVINFLWHQ